MRTTESKEEAILKEDVIRKITRYIYCAAKWHELDEPLPIIDGPGQEMLDLEEEILTAFGLPAYAFQYSSILQKFGFDDSDAKGRADELYNCLQQEAQDYLLSPAQASTKLLKAFKQDWTIAQDALPLMGYNPSNYSCFIYQDIYLRGICDEKELITILDFEQSFTEEGKLVIPYNYKEMTSGNNLAQLEAAGIPHLKAYSDYLQYASSNHSWNIAKWPLDYYEVQDKEELLILRSYFLVEFEIMKRNTVIMDIMIKVGEEYQLLEIAGNTNDLKKVLRGARYISMVSCLLMPDEDLEGSTLPIQYNMFDLYKQNYEICGTDLLLVWYGKEPGLNREIFKYRIVDVLEDKNFYTVN